MGALSVISSLLNRAGIKPLSLRTGATSESNPSAGTPATTDPAATRSPITTGDKAGAAILTLIISVVLIGGGVWLVR